MSKENIPLNFVLDKSKEVILYLGKGEVEGEKELQAWMKDSPSNFKGISCRCEETFYKLSAKVND